MCATETDGYDTVHVTGAKEPKWRTSKQGSWSFEEIGEEFDDHVRRHVPGYDQIEQLVVSTAMWNTYEGSHVLDIGCSTGLTLSLLSSRTPHAFTGYGIDVVESMIDKANQRFAPRQSELEGRGVSINFSVRNIATYAPNAGIPGFDVITSLFAIQFMPTPERWEALDRISKMLNPGGLFVLVEKTLGECAQGADLFNGIYSDWKLQNGVLPDEIIAKWSSLRGRLMPWPGSVYEDWASGQGYRTQLIWCWGPFRAWAFYKPVVD